MRTMKLILLVCVLGCAPKSAVLDKPKIKAEILKFMDDYAVMLKDEFDKVGNLYYDSGAVMTFQGRSRFRVIDSLKASYKRRPKTLEYFKWEDIRVDALASDAALVMAKFYWHERGASDTVKLAYTGLLLKTKEGWKIRHEHESMPCPKCK